MAETESAVNDKSNEKNDKDQVFILARIIINNVLLAIFFFGSVAIIAALFVKKENFDFAKDILVVLLPILSAWVGAVIAYYFTKENYESAVKSTTALIKQATSEEKLRSITMKDVMIPIGKVVKQTLTEPTEKVKLTDMIDLIEKEKKGDRLPILDTEGRIKYMAHRSLFDRFIVRKVTGGKKIDELTLGSMLEDPDMKKMLEESFKTIRETANLAEAKKLMDGSQNCLDVFATEDGTLDTKVIGWVTNAIIGEKSKV